MKLGKMRYRVQMKVYSSDKDKDGFVHKGWKTVETVWADMVPVSGSEYISMNTEMSSVTWKIYIRYREGITADMRLVFGDREFEIVSVLGDKRGGMLTLMAKEVS